MGGEQTPVTATERVTLEPAEKLLLSAGAETVIVQPAARLALAPHRLKIVQYEIKSADILIMALSLL